MIRWYKTEKGKRILRQLGVGEKIILKNGRKDQNTEQINKIIAKEKVSTGLLKTLKSFIFK